MAPSASPLVLVVEDHELTRRFLIENLAADGYRTHAASTLEDARRFILGGEPSLAVLDLGLPDGDGLSLLSELRGRDGVDDGLDPHLPMIVVSGRVTEVDRVRGLCRGADDYLVKPFGYAELREFGQVLPLRSGQVSPGRILSPVDGSTKPVCASVSRT